MRFATGTEMPLRKRTVIFCKNLHITRLAVRWFATEIVYLLAVVVVGNIVVYGGYLLEVHAIV